MRGDGSFVFSLWCPLSALKTASSITAAMVLPIYFFPRPRFPHIWTRAPVGTVDTPCSYSNSQPHTHTHFAWIHCLQQGLPLPSGFQLCKSFTATFQQAEIFLCALILLLLFMFGRGCGRSTTDAMQQRPLHERCYFTRSKLVTRSLNAFTAGQVSKSSKRSGVVELLIAFFLYISAWLGCVFPPLIIMPDKDCITPGAS